MHDYRWDRIAFWRVGVDWLVLSDLLGCRILLHCARLRVGEERDTSFLSLRDCTDSVHSVAYVVAHQVSIGSKQVMLLRPHPCPSVQLLVGFRVIENKGHRVYSSPCQIHSPRRRELLVDQCKLLLRSLQSLATKHIGDLLYGLLDLGVIHTCAGYGFLQRSVKTSTVWRWRTPRRQIGSQRGY